MVKNRNRPRKILERAKTGALACIGIAETACNLPLYVEDEPNRPETVGTGGNADDIELPDADPSMGGTGGAAPDGTAGATSIGGAGGDRL